MTDKQQRVSEQLETRPIRDLVELYPQLMPVLASYGFDLCCGGEHTVAEAAALHGLDPEVVVRGVREALREVRP